MKKTAILSLSLALCLPLFSQTIDECQRAAEQNYPLIRQYDLIGKTADVSVENLQKGWLPQITASAQATYQSDVASWPDEMAGMLSQMGLDMKGLRRDQYRVGIDIAQTVYDGGAIRSQKEIARQQAAVSAAQNDVSLYTLRKRVNEMYFSLLLIDNRIALSRDMQALLLTNEKKLASMYKRGTASESDYNTVRAERISTSQRLTDLTAQRSTLARLLAAFCGMDSVSVTMPADETTLQSGTRPELRLIDERIRLTEARQHMLSSQLMPRLSVFASGFYGYPGYNMFEDMMSHRWSLNGMVGVRMTWNIGALYTHKGDKARLSIERDALDVERSTFLFNNRLERLQQQDNISRYDTLLADDEEIISLREKVRKAAESKLAHGIIDVGDLVREINNENAARMQLMAHKIEKMKQVYDMKITDGVTGR